MNILINFEEFWFLLFFLLTDHQTEKEDGDDFFLLLLCFESFHYVSATLCTCLYTCNNTLAFENFC